MPIDPSISPHDALRVEVLSEALPFIQRFSGRRVVIKYGGAAMVDEHLREAVFRDIALLAIVGVLSIPKHHDTIMDVLFIVIAFLTAYGTSLIYKRGSYK